MTNCPKLVQFLMFVVDATVSGQADDLKETTIGAVVFGRAPDYDPKAETVVRSHAWRLRAKLRDYYNSEGALDPVLIDIPLGHYVPVFSRRTDETAGTGGPRPAQHADHR
jgi:hypothetical protein